MGRVAGRQAERPVRQRWRLLPVSEHPGRSEVERWRLRSRRCGACSGGTDTLLYPLPGHIGPQNRPARMLSWDVLNLWVGNWRRQAEPCVGPGGW